MPVGLPGKIKEFSHCRLQLRLLMMLLCVLGLLVGCASHTAKTRALLSTDFPALSDDQLLLHYYEVEDQIATVERRDRSPVVSLGFGLGSYGGRSSVGAGVGVTTGGRPTDAAGDLRDHRNQVRLELQKRGITP